MACISPRFCALAFDLLDTGVIAPMDELRPGRGRPGQDRRLDSTAQRELAGGHSTSRAALGEGHSAGVDRRRLLRLCLPGRAGLPGPRPHHWAAVVLQLRDRTVYSLTSLEGLTTLVHSLHGHGNRCTWPTSTRLSAPPCPAAGCWPCSALTRSCGATPSSAQRQPRPPAARGRGWPATAPNPREVHLQRSINRNDRRWLHPSMSQSGELSAKSSISGWGPGRSWRWRLRRADPDLPW